MTRVSIAGLGKTYPGRDAAAVAGLDLEIPAGTLAALLGPSGCGKTTTMKMIAGLLAPDAGDIRFDGRSVLGIPPERRGAAMVFQNCLLFPYMTVGENVGFGLRMRHVARAEIGRRVGRLLELVRLPGMEDRRPNELSGGQQQRVALARALIVEPRLLLLDEPLSNLDAHLRFEMRDLIRELQQETGITTVFVTHDQEEAVVLADRVALIFDGRLQQYDVPSAFYETPCSRRVARFFGGVNFHEGRRDGAAFACALGRFAAPRAAAGAEGAGILSIRPEDIRIVAAAGANAVRGRVAALAYVGTHARIRVAVAGRDVHMTAPADTVKRFRPADEIILEFPEDKLWILPPDPD